MAGLYSGHDDAALSAAGHPGANRARPAAVEVTVAGIVSASGNGLQLVQGQLSDELD
jgi:hypothetical protein